MARSSKRRSIKGKKDPIEESLEEARVQLSAHPLFAELAYHFPIAWDKEWKESKGYARVHAHGQRSEYISLRRQKLASEEWAYVIAHCLLHLGFEHLKNSERSPEISFSSCAYVSAFLKHLGFGKAPEGVFRWVGNVDINKLSAQFSDGIPKEVYECCVGGHSGDMFGTQEDSRWGPTWSHRLGKGLSHAISHAVDVAAGVSSGSSRTLSSADRAKKWFIDSFPLLGALAANFKIVDSIEVCRREEVAVAAVSELTQEIYINRTAGLTKESLRFVIAHELLHVGLRHAQRCKGRDHFLWNAACDYVINGWLVEMKVGELPPIGVLYDPLLKGESAESIYDGLTRDIRRAKKLATLRGVGLGDMFNPSLTPAGDAQSLDEFFRRCLIQGLDYHRNQGRGYLPSGLVEEIRSLSHPPIPWDVELAAWFDSYFPSIERQRSFARPSRRQGSTPDIPRPRWITDDRQLQGRTFAVVLDSSGSMDRALLGMALGAIASYSQSRDVPLVRVVYCDAAAYDAGYISPDALASRVEVMGRGGTILQPAIDLIQQAKDFPKDGPILIITDGQCDVLKIKNEHAFLVPQHARLPFKAKGPVFYMGKK